MLFTFINSLTLGMAVFLVAAGLTLIFGIMRILNFAHGAFFMLGAYLAFTIGGAWPTSIWSFLGVALLASAAIGALGYLTDSFAQFLLLNYADYKAVFEMIVVIPGVVGEFSFTVWLLVKGVKSLHYL